MSGYVSRCDRCGKEFKAKPRKKLTMTREVGAGNFSTDSFSRYYCPTCAEGAKKAVRRFEMEGK